MIWYDIMYLPVPVKQVEIEHNGAKYHSRLQQKSLSILLLSWEQNHLGRANLFTRQILDVP